MKTIVTPMLALLCAFQSVGGPSVQKPFEVNGRHLPKQVMGREYWTYLGSGPYTDPGFACDVDVWANPWNNSSLTNLPVFRDCALVRHTAKPPPDSAGKSSAWRTVGENCGKVQWNTLEADAKKDRPFVLVFDGKRHVDAMSGEVELDHGDWAAFKKSRPNLVGTRTMCEWGNDMLLLIKRTTNIVDAARREALQAVWARYSLTNRYDRLALARWYTDRKLKLHYGDMDTFMAFRGMYFLDHVAAAWGAKTLTAETTNTSGGDSEYRWDVSGMFIRGAARQFGLPWCWYEANFFNGPDKDGRMQYNSVCGYRFRRGNARPEGGTSASAQRRCWYYAYLNGANAVEPESWAGQFFTTNTFSGKAELTDRGRNFSDFHDFTAAHPDRGVTYAPVAILVPFAQGYTAHGGAPWASCGQTDGDYALNALFFTIAPGWERAKGLKKGIQEGNLHNSRFAMMYDVLVPDSPQPKDEFAKALFSYPAAILVGDYPDRSSFEDVLADYEKAGGRLIRLNAGDLPPRGGSTNADMIAGRLRFPAVESRLEALQRDLFPFSVKGDCQFGANRTKKGWWLWVFNNKGVRKFADTFETIDHSKDAAVEVAFTKTSVAPVTELMSGRRVEVKDGRFAFTVPAGDFAVFEIGEGAEFAVPRAEFSRYYAAATGKIAPQDAVSFAIDPKVSKTGKDAYRIVSTDRMSVVPAGGCATDRMSVVPAGGCATDRMSVVPAQVAITGSNMRSVMYGVYDLLERRAGCRWFWDGDVVPRRDSIDLSGLDIREEAQFEWRGLRYFAHRGLTRFQAEHWGPADWRREIDWCLKRRLNVFMLRIGQDDLFQRTFPEVCAYPDPSKPLPGAGRGYDNRSLFWSLQYRGRLRHDLQQYAFARGLEVPEDFGTMTHWYSRTPEDFLEKKAPEFLPQATRGYAEKNGLVWDIRDEKWADEYWKLTKTAVDAYGKPGGGLLHTIGLGERLCYTNRADNLKLKLLALDRFLTRAHRDYPEKKVMLGGWDFYFTWYPDEVKELVKTLDPKRDIIWDYEGDATRDYRPEMKKIGGNDFTKWGVVGKFPYTYSIFLAFEDAIDIRANYPLIEKRQKIVQDDPACAGYILWPESSHTDTLCLRFFTANAWAKEAVPAGKVLDEFCASRYGRLAARMKQAWEKVLPSTMLREWGGNYGKLFTRGSIPDMKPGDMASWKEKVDGALPAFRMLADMPWDDGFVRRDTIDLARTALDRAITLRIHELARDVAAWRGRGARSERPRPEDAAMVERAKTLVALFGLMADTLALHTDYSIWESYQRLDAIEKVANPGFTKVLFDNASCGYCRSHQYELARHWYLARMRKAADRLAKAVAANDRKVKLFDDPETERKALMDEPLESLRPTMPRTAANYRRTMLAVADILDDGGKVFSLKDVAGTPRIAVDGKPFVGMCALPEPRLGPGAATFSMKDFSALGVRFFSDIWWAKGKHNDWWLGEGVYDFEAFDRRAKGLLDASPDGWIFPRLKMDPPDWWAKDRPGEMRAGEARPDSEAWRSLYRRMLEDVVRHVENSPYADRVMGYHVGALHGSEWLVWPWPKEEEPPVEWDERDPLPPLEATAARRAYIRKRNKDVADALLDAAAIVKRLTGRRKLVGAFFGYMGNGDHEDSSRVMRSPDIDFLASPGAYDHRRAGQSGRFQLAWPASCRLHGKLYWDESDIRTYHAKTKAAYRCATPEESVGAIKRNLGYALTGGWEVWWFLLAGNDTFHDEQMLSPIRTAFAEEERTFATAQWSPADVAVFTSPDDYVTSLLSVRRGIPVRAHCKIDFHFSTMPYAGVAYDSYDLADIEDPRLPDYKVYVFPNAFTLSEERRAAIKKVVRRAGKTAIWLYAPGYYRNGKGGVGNIEDLTGVRLRENYPVAEGRISRTFTPEGDGTFAADGWRSVYLPIPLKVSALRKALADAGAHIWTDTFEVVAAGRGYLMVHGATDGVKTIRLPECCDVAEIYGSSAPKKGVVSFTEKFSKGETRIYRLSKASPAP